MATKVFCQNCKKPVDAEADLGCLMGIVHIFVGISLTIAGIIPGLIYWIVMDRFFISKRCKECKVGL